MKWLLSSILFFSLFLSFSQNQKKGLILDYETREPLEFVTVFNSKDHTISNSDGQFEFTSSKDSLIFFQVGYDKLTTTFNQLKDTVLLNKSVLALNEVTVTNRKSIWEKFKDSARSNYRFEPYKERFFLRCILRRNDTIVRLQDMVGKLKRKTLIYPESLEEGKKDYEVELTNMRKVGIDTDENDIYFIFPSFHDTFKEFVRLNATGEGFELEEFQFDQGAKTRLNFKAVDAKGVWKNEGHYIIDNADNAILSFERSMTSKGASFQKNNWLRYRTLRDNRKMFFEKDLVTKDYYLKSAKQYAIVEAMDKKKSFRNVFTIEILLTTHDNFGAFPVKSNINEHKDMFKLKHPYNPEYWNSQNQLLLTDEMRAFINRMGQEDNEFKIKSNMN